MAVAAEEEVAVLLGYQTLLGSKTLLAERIVRAIRKRLRRVFKIVHFFNSDRQIPKSIRRVARPVMDRRQSKGTCLWIVGTVVMPQRLDTVLVGHTQGRVQHPLTC